MNDHTHEYFYANSQREHVCIHCSQCVSNQDMATLYNALVLRNAELEKLEKFSQEYDVIYVAPKEDPPAAFRGE